MALAWALPDESSTAATRVLESALLGETLWVPAVWWYEMSNGLLAAQRGKRISAAETEHIVELFRGLSIQTDANLSVDGLLRLTSTGSQYGLSAYDAAYLELAARRDLRLASLDSDLIKAARKAGVEVA